MYPVSSGWWPGLLSLSFSLTCHQTLLLILAFWSSVHTVWFCPQFSFTPQIDCCVNKYLLLTIKLQCFLFLFLPGRWLRGLNAPWCTVFVTRPHPFLVCRGSCIVSMSSHPQPVPQGRRAVDARHLPSSATLPLQLRAHTVLHWLQNKTSVFFIYKSFQKNALFITNHLFITNL